MIMCNHCNACLGTIQESEEIQVRGEVNLHLMCGYCEEVNLIKLYEYNKKRLITDKK
ncbi:hypothetical protein 268TH004_82 [Bacillus phage 268TH004]|uniref:Uncharacterized protein n=1 Tax=Bacillus phage 268TH004 TaxID=2801523 RepID=A0A7T8C2F9_9CAUD|nr:hypothetical protein 268TH004_82 [Bacillus phage 268TH004]